MLGCVLCCVVLSCVSLCVVMCFDSLFLGHRVVIEYTNSKTLKRQHTFFHFVCDRKWCKVCVCSFCASGSGACVCVCIVCVCMCVVCLCV